jgi:hypothetical protein
MNQEVEETERRQSAYDQIRSLSRTQKLLLALRAERYERKVLSKEPDPEILLYLCKNPKITLDEILYIARSGSLNGPVAEIIARNAAWIQSETLRLTLIENPRTPVPLALRLIPALGEKNLRTVARNWNLKTPIKQAALRLVIQKGDAGGR